MKRIIANNEEAKQAIKDLLESFGVYEVVTISEAWNNHDSLMTGGSIATEHSVISVVYDALKVEIVEEHKWVSCKAYRRYVRRLKRNQAKNDKLIVAILQSPILND